MLDSAPVGFQIGPPVDPATNALIRRAIAECRIVRFELDGCVRIAEPHDYGIKGGVAQLLVFQIAGQSRSGKLPNWRWVNLAKATAFELLAETFDGGRAIPSGKHSAWDELFARVRPGQSV